MGLTGKTCTYKYSEKVEHQGNTTYEPREGTGQILSEPYMKQTEQGQFMFVMVHDIDGTVRETFANGLKTS